LERLKDIRILLITGMLLIIWAGLSGAQEGPVIEIDAPTHNFGQVTEGEIVKHDFRVLNRGWTTLEIKHVKPG
jgi:hypothetical protein